MRGVSLRKRYIILLLAATLAGCGSEQLSVDCSQQMEDLRDELGQPQEVEGLDAGPYHRYTYWYWTLGFARTFTWDGGYNSCETVDQTFPPSEQRPGSNPAPGA
jgi:hypothetical protein